MKDKHEKDYWVGKIKEIIKDYTYKEKEGTWKDLEDGLDIAANNVFDHIEIAILKDQLQQLTNKISAKLYGG